MALSNAVRTRLEIQGYVGLPDATLASVAPWLRWSPALCAIVMALGTALASPWILLGLMPFAALGAIMTRHPFDYLYNHGVRRLTGTLPLPEHGAPRRFACGLAAVWMTATAAAFASGAPVAGYALGGILTGVAALVSVTHFCIPSLVFRTVFRRPVGCEATPRR